MIAPDQVSAATAAPDAGSRGLAVGQRACRHGALSWTSVVTERDLALSPPRD